MAGNMSTEHRDSPRPRRQAGEWKEVTAAHCVDGAATGQFAFGDPVVVFGAEVTSGAERLVPMAEWIPHPSWNGSLENGADIGLVRVAEPQDD